MTVARHPQVLARDDPAARVDNRRRQRPLVRIDPHHVARVIGVISTLEGPGPLLLLARIARSPACRRYR
jgi:hypothetical protein